MNMDKIKTLGRYEPAKYIESIKRRFEENFPDSVPKDFVIDHIIKYFWQYVEDELMEDRQVSIFSYGKFYLNSRVSPRTGNFQHYPKFKFSRHFILRLREVKGTATEAELKEIETKREFMKEVWESRKAYMIANKGKLPSKFQEQS